MRGSALGTTNDPAELIPGDAGAIVRLMYTLRDLGDSLTQAGGSLAALNTQAGWQGEAAEAFRSRFGDEPPRWTDAGRGFHDAADALDRYATALGHAQEQARIAIQQWQQGQTLTAQAQDGLDDAQAPGGGAPMTMGELMAGDPGQAHREEAQRTLDTARRTLDSAGGSAEDAVRSACAKAPKEPGFWSKLGHKVADGLYNTAAGTVNGLASYGNALLHHPEDALAMLGGVGLTTISAGGEVLGVTLDATGVGSVAGVPLNVVSAAGIVAGGTLAGGGALDLGQHAAGDNRVNVMESRASSTPGRTGRSGDSGPRNPTDRHKEHLTDRDLDAARRELNGEVVARKSDGTPWDHVDEVRNSQRGLTKRIQQLQRQLSDTRTAEADKAALQEELSEASKLLDYSKQFVPTK